MKKIWQHLRALGPYLAIELLLPGGTLLALALWLARRNTPETSGEAPAVS